MRRCCAINTIFFEDDSAQFESIHAIICSAGPTKIAKQWFHQLRQVLVQLWIQLVEIQHIS